MTAAHEKVLSETQMEEEENQQRIEALSQKLTELIGISTIELREIPAATQIKGWADTPA